MAIAAAAVLLAGCGGSEPGQAASPTASPPGVSEPAGSAEPAPQQSDQVVLDVTIEGGSVTPTNEQLQAAVGQPIVLRVDSDSADELHVHSTPEHTFPVAAQQGQSFEFTVDMPGRVDVELHNSHTTIATILVR
ncbi:hypothetical protein MDUV_45100 [Mycolicibacterium duvalii]|uniref:EfeO-type cupredoxin-like domain-containing protein n=1 Tax=Mycolicibacterium duvalii TaxID=39688 RepID=A0A7I7K658_9MYCO|nr:hypothetical protein MDUV_45100 [Mycolicibacterium duvalii]